MTVYASSYCEVGSLSPAHIKKLTYGSAITTRLKAYAEMRQVRKKNAFPEPLLHLNHDHFVKTGSGQEGNAENSGVFSQDIEVKLSAGEVPDMDEAMAELERKYSEVEEELVNPGRCGKRLFWRHFLLKN